MTPSLVFLNGVVSESVSVFDRGFQFGDGVFETLLISQGKLFLADRHWQRLQEGLGRLSINCPQSRIERDVVSYLSQCPWIERNVGVLKLVVTRGVSQRGYKAVGDAQASIAIWASMYEPSPTDCGSGVTVRLCEQRLSANSQLAGIKHLNRLEQVLARAEWDDDDIFEGIMLGQQNNVIEGTMSNIFMVKQGRLLTSSLRESGVAGTMRAEILESIAPSLSIYTDVRSFEFAELCAADEVFICNSVMGVLPVTQCADVQWSIGPVTNAIQGVVNGSMAV